MDKIFTFNSLIDNIDKIRSKDKKIILCHGVFDLIHIGHIKYFQEAKLKGDILIVTLTPDKYVNKGPNRPAFNEILRAEAIAAINVVDYVSINKWPTAIETIKSIKPDYYIKGPDYKNLNEDITGNINLENKAIKSVGGEIFFTSGPTFSSSNLINNYINTQTPSQKDYIYYIKEKYDINSINKFFKKLDQLKVLLVGESIIDEYVFCNSIGKSGKEPVLVNQKLYSEKYAGGILAVANHISNFCTQAKIISYVGDRDNQLEFIEQNLNSNVKFCGINKSDSPTILKTRFIDIYSNSKIAGIYDLNDNYMNEPEEKKINEKIMDCVSEYDIVIVVDYGHGLITPNVVNTLQNNAKYLAVNTQLNSFNIGYHTISNYTKADYVCVHEGELRHDYRNRDDSIKVLTKLLSDRIEADVITITRGKEGSVSYKNEEFIDCPAFSGKVIDRIGAGDTLLAITALCFAADIPADLTLLIGNLAAAETVASTGTGNKLNKNNLIKAVHTLLK